MLILVKTRALYLISRIDLETKRYDSMFILCCTTNYAEDNYRKLYLNCIQILGLKISSSKL